MLARPAPGYPLFRGMMPGWDNTPRVQDRAHCFVNAEPANYARWEAGGDPLAPRYRKVNGLGTVEGIRDACLAALRS